MCWQARLIEKMTIRSPDDIRPAAEALDVAATERGFRVSMCADIASPDQILDANGAMINAEVFGWTADGERWWENRRLALYSPLPRACRYESEPFWVNEDGAHTLWHNLYLDDLSFAEFHKYVHSASVILVPAHLPFGQIGAASFMPMDYSIRDLSDAIAEHGELFGTLTRRFLSSYVASRRTQHWIPSDCSLSKREVECLRWAAVGKTDREIGMILTLSHATVRYHVQRAVDKLNAVNRSQAVFKAGQLGYLGAAA
jgi:DNA-binding CsgD family transcriptional regulator